MYYIRLLRPARIEGLIPSEHHRRRQNPSHPHRKGKANPNSPHLALLITITTDLGDSFLYTDWAIGVELAVSAHAVDDEDEDDDDVDVDAELLQRQAFRWTPGLRVLALRPRLRMHPARREDLPARFRVTISCPDPSQGEGGSEGEIVPLTVEMRGAACAPVSLRTLQGPAQELCFEEDIGESIARHVWDAGVVAARMFLRGEMEAGELLRGKGASVLELGCGVGVLGICVAAAMESAAAAAAASTLRNTDGGGGGGGGGGSSSDGDGERTQSTILLTDLPEAEDRARANLSRADVALTNIALTRGAPEDSSEALRATRLRYENLDWDEGRQGRFGPLVGAGAPWDLVVLSDCTYNADSLPALVGTLSALHGVSVAAAAKRDEGREGEEKGEFKSTVLLATKPRHESEKALFGLLDKEGWRHRLWKSIPLPNMAGEDEVVEIYLLEKGRRDG
ncbi:hypothetical protein F4810DRAFT_711977 [Camillea tinctor]|nr:hypothetical protein F4810DRAFT_711977 [Camillea tinctor]